MEDGPIDRVFQAPRHPYTALLVASAPGVAHDTALLPQQLRRADGDTLSPASGRRAGLFAPGCPFAIATCGDQPALLDPGDGWAVAGHHQGEWRPQAEGRAVTSPSRLRLAAAPR